jgi:cobalamin biosynthesis protein CobW
MPQRVPALVVTGFLGSGKTTLLRRLIEGQPGVRFAVVVNEFGETGFDGALIASQCADVIELVNGCVCCRVGEDFVPTLEKIIERDMPPEVILIETSGLALPQPVIEAFEFPTLKARTRLAGVVTLADAGQILSGTFDAALSRLSGPATPGHRPSALHGGTDGTDDPVDELFEDQLRAADIVIVSKTDLGDGQGTALRRLRQVLPDTIAIESGVALDPASLMKIAAGPRARHALEDHDHDDFVAFSLDLGRINDRQALAKAVAGLMRDHRLLRVKGFVAIQERSERFVLQATPGSTIVTQEGVFVGTATTRLVVIGPTGLDRMTIETDLRRAAQ